MLQDSEACSHNNNSQESAKSYKEGYHEGWERGYLRHAELTANTLTSATIGLAGVVLGVSQVSGAVVPAPDGPEPL
jgi:hypothetical protein